MSGVLYKIINEILNVEDLKFLELGLGGGGGGTFRKINCKHKRGVDTLPIEQIGMDLEGQIFCPMTTDDYFSSGTQEKFDIIFIDACHEYTHVLKDFNNSTKCLNPGGVIFIHDLVPIDANHTQLHLSGDGYNLLYHLWQIGYKNVITMNTDCGLTMFLRPKEQVSPPEENKFVSYDKLMEEYSKRKIYSEDEMTALLIAHFGEQQ